MNAKTTDLDVLGSAISSWWVRMLTRPSLPGQVARVPIPQSYVNVFSRVVKDACDARMSSQEAVRRGAFGKYLQAQEQKDWTLSWVGDELVELLLAAGLVPCVGILPWGASSTAVRLADGTFLAIGVPVLGMPAQDIVQLHLST